MGENEYQAFVAWYKQMYGVNAPIPPNEPGVVGSPLYDAWKSQGRPGFVGLQDLPRGEAEREASRWTPPPQPTEPPPDFGEYVIPGVLVRFRDGRYEYSDGTPVNFEVAQRMLEEYNIQGEAPAEGMTPYQQAQIDMAQQRMGMEREQWQASLMNEPVDWIRRWKTMQMPTRPQRDIVEERTWGQLSPEERGSRISLGNWGGTTQSMLMSGRTQLGSMYQDTGQRDPGFLTELGKLPLIEDEDEEGIPVGPYPVTMPGSKSEAWRVHYGVSPERWEAVKGGGGTSSRMGSMAGPKPKGIPVPEWLPEFVPELKGKTHFTEFTPLRTPSAQQWAKAPWSVREGLRGYQRETGGRPWSDILEHMEMMQPKPARGATSKRWTPARQR